MENIDRSSPLPLYEQIKHIIQNQILAGEYMVGERIPTEVELCDFFEVSRITVKRALSDLSRAGMLERRQGIGTIVARKLIDGSVPETRGFSEITRRHDQKPTSRVLDMTIVDATEQLCGVFRLPSPLDVRFVRFRRLMSIDGRPAALLLVYVPESVGRQMAGNDLTNQSFYALYQKISGKKIGRNENTLSPVAVSPEVAKLLDVEAGSAHMHIRSVTYFDDEEPVELSTGVFSGTVFEWKANTYNVREPGVAAAENRMVEMA